MFNKILVPLDGSKVAERALLHAEEFARIFHSKLVLLQVLDPSIVLPEIGSIEPLKWQILKSEAQRYLQMLTAEIQNKGFEVENHLLEGGASDNIINFAQTENIDLLVISSHGKSGINRWNNSSVTQKVVNSVYLPVLLVRSYQPPLDPEEKEHYHRILVTVDGSKRAECSLPTAITIAEESHAVLILASVIRRPLLPFPTPVSDKIQELSDEFVRLSQEAVEQYIEELRNRIPVKTEQRITESDSVSQSLHALVEQENPDLIVSCAHGLTGIPRWPYGSIAGNLIDHGHISTLIIQDVPRSQAKPTAAELAAEKYGKR